MTQKNINTIGSRARGVYPDRWFYVLMGKEGIEMRISDIIIGRRGESISGKVMDRSLDISSVLGKISVKTGSITWIHFMNPPQLKQDEIWLKNDDRLTGKIKQDVILFKLEDGTRREIPRDAIHTIIINQALNERGKKLI
jgi:hypothetical protein